MFDFPTQLAISNHGLRNSGGIERYALTLVRGLHARGIRPIFAAKVFDETLPEYAWVDPVRVGMGIVPGKLRDFWFDRRLRTLKRREGWAPLIACNQTGAADIAICGSNHPAYLDAMRQRPGRIDRWKIALEREHLTAAHTVVAHSVRVGHEAVQRYGIDPRKVALLYPPVDTERFSTVDEPTRNALRAKLGLPTDRAVFLLASTGHKRKGLELLSEFFARTNLPITLAIAGRPTQETVRNVRHLGYRSDMENVYRAVDFTVMASVYEPFGLVGVESVLSGTPVLLSEHAGCAEVIRRPAQLPFLPDQPDSLAVAIDAAVARWRGGQHRLRSPLDLLSYDPGVNGHLDALLGLARACTRSADRDRPHSL